MRCLAFLCNLLGCVIQTGTRTTGCSLLECCALVYCAHKISKCCKATKIALTKCCASVTDSVIGCGVTISSICDSNASEEATQDNPEIDLVGVNHTDSAV